MRYPEKMVEGNSKSFMSHSWGADQSRFHGTGRLRLRFSATSGLGRHSIAAIEVATSDTAVSPALTGTHKCFTT